MGTCLVTLRRLIWQALRAQLVPEHYVSIVQDMYNNVTTRVVSPAGISDSFEVKVGAHQGSALSPLLFNIVMDYITKHLQKPAPWTLLYADDVVLVEESLPELQINLEAWRAALEGGGLRVSRQKTEYMHCNFSDNNINIQSPPTIDGSPLNKVEEFKYLGSVINTRANTENDLLNRINTGWLKWRSLTGVLCDPKMPIKTKGTVYKRAVRPALLYGSECWGIRKCDEQKMHVTEMKMLRWAGGVTRVDRIRNEYIRGTFKVTDVQRKMQESRLRWYGHVMRRDESHMTRRVMAIDEGKRGRGRPPTTWTRTISRDMTELGLTPDMTQDRTKWRTRIRRADPK